MRHTIPLYRFMPYGAPELIESRERHMSRALLLTSALALVLWAAAGGIASLVPARTDAPREIVFELDRWEPPPPVPARASEPPAGAAPVREDAAPVAVKDDVAPAPDLPVPGTVRGEDVGPGPAVATEGSVTPGPAAEALPARGDYVYVETLPAPLREVRPEYPPIAVAARIEGLVTVHVLVGKDGRVLDAVLAEKLQVPMLNEAALAAARQWRFSPGLANGHPVACWTAIPFRFRLQ